MRKAGGWLGRLGVAPSAALAALLLLPAAPGLAHADEPPTADSATPAGSVAEPPGYRTDDYRAPTPLGLTGAATVDTAEARRLWEAKSAVFVDTLPRAPKPQGLPAGTVWRPKVRADIPGSIWLVDTGYGALAPIMEGYFLSGLDRATSGDKTKPLVFYCLRDCWMSWNAAKRAVAAGYRSVHWYPDGTDGWAEAGLPLEHREPETRPDE